MNITLRTLSLPLKVLASCYLVTIGMGYLFAISYLYLMDVRPHAGQHMGLVTDVIVKYYGRRNTTRLEAALAGPMADRATADQKQVIAEWIHDGATEAGFARVQPILEQQCVMCHRPQSGLPVPPLTSYDEVKTLAETDMGQSVKSLVSVSHIHLFGISFIFMLAGLIFAFSELPSGWRAALIVAPFVSIWIDIGSWWFTKSDPIFAYTVVLGGALMGVALAAQIVLSLYEMWLKRQP